MTRLMGRTAEATLRVIPENADTLLSVSGPDGDAAPASSRLAEVMEQAAVRLMRRGLDDGESSVAISTTLHHAALSRTRGDTLHARATCVAMEGRLYRFEVNVFDESGLIASGEHVRALVAARRVEAAARCHALPAMLLQA